jgi:hypothetical protein
MAGGREKYIHLFSGSGIGLLVGAIVGLSVSHVVGIVLGSLTALLAAFLGLKDSKRGDGTNSTETECRSNMKWLRTGAFGFFCTIGILLGIFIRTHGILSVPIDQKLSKWTSAGYVPAQARHFVVYEELGLKPRDWEIADVEAITRRRHESVLFSQAGSEICQRLAIDQFDDPKEALNAFSLEGKKWEILASEIDQSVPVERKMRLLRSIWEALCEK